MKKVVVSLFLLVAISQSSWAQIELGPRVSLVSANIILKSEDPINAITDARYRAGFQAGVYARLPIIDSKLFLQPELLYSSTAGRLEETSMPSFFIEYEFERLDLPLLLGTKLGFFRLNAGPVFRFQLDTKRARFNNSARSIKDSFESVTFGYQAGGGVDISRFSLDLKYEGSFVNANRSEEDGGIIFDIRVSQVVFALGYRLF